MAQYHVAKQCILCGREPGGEYQPGEWTFRCKTCGDYRALSDDEPFLENIPDSSRLRLSCLVRELSAMPGRREYPLLSEENLPAMLSQTPDKFDVPGRARKLLLSLKYSSVYPGCVITAHYHTDAMRCYSKLGDRKQAVYFFAYLVDRGWLSFDNNDGGHNYVITPAGWQELERRPHTESDKAFVAMSFAPELTVTYTQAIEPAIREMGFKAIRIDLQEHNEGIVDRVIAEIKESRFVVADLTGNRGGVYYEAGYAKGLGREVIYTWRQSDDPNDKPHFDVQHLNQIHWTDHATLRKRIKDRIRATLGKGPLATLPDA